MESKMSRQDRAKQFMPFAALKGYTAALQKKEKILVPKMEFSEDYQDKLNRILRQVKKKDIVTVVYYEDRKYVRLEGMVSRVDATAQILKVINTKILFTDLREVCIVEVAEETK